MRLRLHHALSGLFSILGRREFVIHSIAGALVIAFGILFCLDSTRWGFVVIAIGIVFAAEAFNTALEELGTTISPRQHARIRRAKDMSAAAVLITAATAAVLGLLVFVPAFLSAHGSCLSSGFSGTI